MDGWYKRCRQLGHKKCSSCQLTLRLHRGSLFAEFLGGPDLLLQLVSIRGESVLASADGVSDGQHLLCDDLSLRCRSVTAIQKHPEAKRQQNLELQLNLGSAGVRALGPWRSRPPPDRLAFTDFLRASAEDSEFRCISALPN